LQSVIPEKYKQDINTNITKKVSVTSGGFFQKTKREILIFGDPQSVKQHENKLEALIAYLKEKGIDGSKIRKIGVGDNQLTIYTVDDRSVKTKIRDEVFGKELNANKNIKNIDGKFEFIIKSLDQLALPEVNKKAQLK
jgi:hypothetical protein